MSIIVERSAPPSVSPDWVPASAGEVWKGAGKARPDAPPGI